MAEKTPAKILHDALVGILTGAVADLAVDSRTVRVLPHLPDHTFSQKSFPLVVVERPTMETEEPWSAEYVRQVYTVPFGLADHVGVAPGEAQQAMERLDLLRDKVRKVFARDANANLQVAFLTVFYSMCQWEEAETREAGNNLLVKELALSVPMTLEKGKIWDV